MGIWFSFCYELVDGIVYVCVVDFDEGNVVVVVYVEDGVCLFFKIDFFELVFFQYVEFVIWYCWWCQYYNCCVVIGWFVFVWVIFQLYFVCFKWMWCKWLEICLFFLVIDYFV